MDWLKTRTVLSSRDWAAHILSCNEYETAPHLGVVSGSIIPGADGTRPEPPFLCYSVLREETDIGGNISNQWVHFCFTIVDAAIIGAQHEEMYKEEKEKVKQALKENESERRKTLEDDLMEDLEDIEEDLGTITSREALEIAKENEQKDN